MSAQKNGKREQVNNEENYSDQKIKERIHKSRTQLTEARNKLETARLIEPSVDYSEFQANVAWGKLVQSYIRDLSILLNNANVQDSEYYRDDVELGYLTLVPQNVEGVPFSDIVYDDVDKDDIVRRSSELGRGADVPRPEHVRFTGLLDLCQYDIVLEKQWSVVANPRAAPPNQRRIQTADRKPIPQSVFKKALMEADEFLQGSGLGLDMSDSGVPDFGFEEVADDVND